MSNFSSEVNGVLNVNAGAQISYTLKEAVRLARERDGLIAFNFNEVKVNVMPESDVDLLYRDFMRAMNRYIEKEIGPFPSPELSAEELENDARVAEENRREQQRNIEEEEAKDLVKRKVVEEKLLNAPPMEEADPEYWENAILSVRLEGSSSYGNTILDFAQCWARLMQIEIAKGKKLEDIARDTAREADIYGISGYMYNIAVGLLSKVWVHGETLRRWHNIDVAGDAGKEVNETGGVLNSAILVIQSSSEEES